jgi:hypothetical protein
MAHTAPPPAPFVLHRTSIGKGAMKTFRINCQWRSELFLILIFHFSFGQAAMGAPCLWKECVTLTRHCHFVPGWCVPQMYRMFRPLDKASLC